MAWCGFMRSGRLVSASKSKLVQIWDIAAAEGDAAAAASADGPRPSGAIAMRHIFPAAARFGAPDGVGGQGDVRGGGVCIGDEAGGVYVLQVS